MGCNCSTAVEAVEPAACQKSIDDRDAPICTKKSQDSLRPKIAPPIQLGEALTPPGAVTTPGGAQSLPWTPSSCPSAIDLSPAAARTGDVAPGEPAAEPPGAEEAPPGAAAVAAAAPEPAEESPPKPTRQLSWEPVECGTEEMAEAFKAYVARVPPEITRTLNCSWEHVAAAAATGGAGADALQWFWLLDAGQAPVEGGRAENAVGLAVFRVARGAVSNHGQILHLSMAVPDWREEMLPALRALRQEMMRCLSVPELRVTLWYFEHEDKYRIDLDVEAAFKQAGFRWFQLTNTSDGKRGQIKQAKRNRELGDPEAPEAVPDLRLCSCLFLPLSGAGGAAAEAAPAAGDVEEAGARAPSNGLVMAECLRRHQLQQPDGGGPLLPATVPDEEGGEEAEGGAEQAAKKPRLGGGALAGDLFRKLTRRGTVDLVRSADAESAADCETFAERCLAGLGGEEGGALAVRKLLQTPAPGADAPETRVLCGGLALAINWKDCRSLPGEADWVRVPVQATGRAEGPRLQEGGDAEVLYYLGTEDDDLFVSVWQLPADAPSDIAQDELYSRCQSMLKKCPPTEVGEARAVAEVALPRFRVRALAAAEVPQSVPQAQAFGAPREVLAAQLAVRPPPRGALAVPSASEDSAAGGVLKLERPFVLCAWDTRLDDLEVPLVALVVRPQNWEAARRAG